MNSALILLVAVGLSCLMAAQAASSFGVLAGLGALTSAVSKRRYHGASHGRGHGHGYRAPKRKYRLRYGRSVAAAADEDDDLILSAVGQLDPNTCVPKMFCLLQAKDESDRTLKENMLVEVLTDNTMKPNSYNTAFVYARDVATKTKDSSACKKAFPKCSLGEEELNELLDLAWSCDCGSGGKE
ncbi:uncharacterized protein LOC119595048 [Penaeus monodon]|uniref:uncharacterized protein LOC119595048 n=1 Tax=Penaeus monodon TaxID=6687 RepID=UPI0018A758D7|nr:uncharacterized protein LOC119595048 [Penaeus monodon]